MPDFWSGLQGGMEKGAGFGAQLARDLRAQQAAEAARAYGEDREENNFKRNLMLKDMDAAESERRWNAEMKLKERALNKTGAGTLPPGLKLKPGERYNPQTDMVEQIPGSALYQEQAGKHGKDYQALQAAQAGSKMASEKVQGLLSDFPTKQFGGVNAYVSQFLDPSGRNKVESLKANLKAQGLQLMRGGGGIGAISEREWPIMESMIDRLSPAMSEADAKLALQNIQAKFDQLASNTQSAYQLEWGNTPYTQPMRTPGGQVQQQADPDAELKAILGL